MGDWRFRSGAALAIVALGAIAACSILTNLDSLDSSDGATDAPPTLDGSDAAPTVFLQPTEGIYSFRDALLDGSFGGYATLDLNDGGATALQQDAVLMFASVVHGVQGDANPFCWTFTITPVVWDDASTNAQGHVEVQTFCPSASTLFGGGAAAQSTRFDLSGSIGPQNAFTTLQCSTGERYMWTADAGDQNMHLCNGDTPVGTTPVDFRSTGSYAFESYQMMTLDTSEQVLTFHAHIDRTITPQATGDASSLAISGLDQSDYWFATDNGMVVEWKRNVTVKTSIGIYGAIVFNEVSDWRLVGLIPTPLPDAG